MSGLRIKGMTVKARLDFARTRGGEALVERLKGLPGPAGDLVRTPLLSVREFAVGDVELLANAIVMELGGDPSIHEEMGAHSADLNRTLLKMVHRTNTDPHQLLRGVIREFPNHLAGEIGAAEYLPDDNGSGGRIVWKGHPESGLSHCLSSIGYATRVLQNWGVKGANGANLRCMHLGHPECVWGFVWESVTGHLRSTRQIKSDALAERIRKATG